MLSILDRYIIKKFFITFFFMLMMISLIIVIIDFSERLDDFMNRKVPFLTLFTEYYPQMVIQMVNLLSPICIFLTVILFTARLAQSTEIVAILAGGISFYRFLLPYLILAAVLTAGSFYLNAFVVPKSVIKKMDYEYKYLKNNNPYDKRNIHIKTDKETFITLYAYNQFDKAGENFVLERFKDGILIYSIQAATLKWVEKTKSWLILNGKYRRFNGDSETMIERASHDTVLNLAPGDIFRRDQYSAGLSLPELEAFIEKEKIRGSDTLDALILEKYARYAYPFATIILTIIGVSLSSRKTRGGTAFQIGIGLVISFLYIFVLVSAQVSVSDYFPHWLAVWMPNIVFSLVALFLLRIAPK